MLRDGSRRGRYRSIAGLVVAMAGWALAAHAVPVTLPTDAGSRVFDSTQFADGVLGSRLGHLSFTFQGPFPADFNGVSVAEAVLGPDLTNGVAISRDDSVTLGFSQRGPVLALWEAGDLREVGRTLLEASSDGGATFGAVAVLFQPTPASPDPEPSGYQTNFQLLDATRFGLPAGSLIDALRISVQGGDAAFVHTDILAVATVPEPSSFALLALGLLGLRLARRVR